MIFPWSPKSHAAPVHHPGTLLEDDLSMSIPFHSIPLRSVPKLASGGLEVAGFTLEFLVLCLGFGGQVRSGQIRSALGLS
jgi:hypothetical protein